MTQPSLINLQTTINPLHKNTLCNHLFELLLKSQAMARVALNDDFANQPPAILYTYLSMLDETITEAVEACNELC